MRPSRGGLSLVVEYQGTVLGASDFYTTDRQSTVASVPLRGVRTIYSVVADLFAWLAIGGLLAVAVRKKPKVGVSISRLDYAEVIHD